MNNQDFVWILETAHQTFDGVAETLNNKRDRPICAMEVASDILKGGLKEMPVLEDETTFLFKIKLDRIPKEIKEKKP